MGIYATFIRPLAFRIEPERVHRLAIGAGGWLSPFAGALRSLMTVSDPRLASYIAGIHFLSPIGLATGFDKSGEAIEARAALDFGFIEIGSVSIDPSDGNPRPRLFRLPIDLCVPKTSSGDDFGFGR